MVPSIVPIYTGPHNTSNHASQCRKVFQNDSRPVFGVRELADHEPGTCSPCQRHGVFRLGDAEHGSEELGFLLDFPFPIFVPDCSEMSTPSVNLTVLKIELFGGQNRSMQGANSSFKT